jgi:fatty acid desaturase
LTGNSGVLTLIVAFAARRTMSSTIEPTADAAGGPADPYQPYRKTLLSPQRVRELSELRPGRAVADTVWLWACILAAWTVVAVWPLSFLGEVPRWWAVAVTIPIVATRYYALLIVGHDAIHRRLFRSPRWNDAFADLFVFGPVAAITRINNQNHLGHHRHLTTADDPDLHQFTCLNKHHWHLLLGYLSGASSLYRSFHNVFLRDGKSTTPGPESRAAPTAYTLRDLAIIGLWQAALIGGLTWLVAWWAYPVLWLVPLYLAFMADNFRAFAEHSQPRADSWANQHRLITYLSNPLERVFVAPLNMNYHAAHHLWPSIPYYNLPTADREIRRHPSAAGIEWRGSYFAYLLRYFRLLPLHECQPGADTPLPAIGTREF